MAFDQGEKLKKFLEPFCGYPRFRLKLLRSPGGEVLPHGEWLDGDEELQLIVMSYVEPDPKLELFLFMAGPQGNFPMVEHILKYPYDPNFVNKQGSTPLHVASEAGQKECASLLVEARANVNQGDRDGATPLFLASQSGHAECVELLLSHRADMEQARADSGATPLLVACENGYSSIARLLLELAADKTRARSDTGATPFFVAAERGHLEIVELLLEFGVDKNQACTDSGITPLYAACGRGWTQTVSLLIQARCSVDQANKQGLTPLHCATAMHCTEIVTLLRAASAEDAHVGFGGRGLWDNFSTHVGQCAPRLCGRFF